jgi:hypothetical protein
LRAGVRQGAKIITVNGGGGGETVAHHFERHARRDCRFNRLCVLGHAARVFLLDGFGFPLGPAAN